MGCCDSREETTEIKEHKVKIRTVSKYIDVKIMQNQDLMVLPERQMAGVDLNPDLESIRYYIEWCNHKKKWKELSIFIWDNTPITEKTVKNIYSQSPNTLSSLVLIFFRQVLQEKSSNPQKICENLIPDLIKLTPLNNSDYLINFLLLLDQMLNENPENLPSLLIEFGFFEVTKPFISVKCLMVCKLVLHLTKRVYSENKLAQDQFIKCESAKKVVLVLENCGKCVSELLLLVLESLWGLLKLPGENINYNVQAYLIEYKLSDLLISIPPPLSPSPYSILLYHLFNPQSSPTTTSLI